MPFIGKQSTSNSQITNYTTTVGSGGQTNFTVVIEGGDETHVYLNGVLLKETTDYTVSSTQVSLVSPAVENDIVEIKVFRSFALVDAVKATGGTFSGDVVFSGNTTGVDVNGTELVLDADGDTSITADTDDQIDFRAGGTDSVKIGNEHLTINDGNLVIGTAGHGIDFSINSHQSGMTSELLDAYEEGTFSPTLLIGGSSASGTVDTGGTYIKIGNLVQVTLEIDISSAQSGSSSVTIGNLPFTSASNSGVGGNSITAIRSNRIAGSDGFPLIAQLAPSSSTITILTIRNAETSSSPGITGDNIGSSSILRLTLNYKTD